MLYAPHIKICQSSSKASVQSCLLPLNALVFIMLKRKEFLFTCLVSFKQFHLSSHYMSCITKQSCHCLQNNMKLEWIPWNLSFESVISTYRCCPHLKSKSSILFLSPRVSLVRWPRTCSNCWSWKEEFLFTSMISFNQFHLSSHYFSGITKQAMCHC